MADRLSVFDREVQDTRFIIHIAVSPCEIPEDSIAAIAQKVISASNLGDKKLVYLIVTGWNEPYYKGNDYFPSIAMIYKQSFYTSIPEVNSPIGQQNSGELPTNIFNIYRQIPKPYYLLKHFITGVENGIYLTMTEVENGGTIRGEAHIYDYALLVDKRIEDLNSLKSESFWNDFLVVFKGKWGSLNEEDANKYIEESKKYQKEIDNLYSTRPLEYERKYHGLRESILMEKGGKQTNIPLLYDEWYISTENQFFFTRLTTNDLKGEYFISGRNEAFGDDLLSTLDVVGLGLSPFGLDITTDVLGVCVAGYYNKPEESALYLSGAVLPFVSGGIVKTGIKGITEIKGIAKGTHVVEKMADGTLMVVKRGLSHADISIAKDVLKQSLDAETYSKLIASYGEESIELLKYVDNGKVNHELIDAWKAANNVSETLKYSTFIEKLKGAKGLIGKEYEDFLARNLPDGQHGFKLGGRDFDVLYIYNGEVKWVEAKSGRYWVDQTATPEKLAKFKSDMGSRLKIANDHNIEYQLFSNTPIPQNVKEWLTSKGIKYIETLE